jgi:mono/diheme cytochrome c family protein
MPALGVAASLLAGCSKPTFTQPMTLAGQQVSAKVLEHGQEEYTLYCRACHGDKGDGNGPSSFGLRPPPRDFTKAQFKFGWVVDGLPHDDDLRRIVKSGLHGTAMLAWGMPDRELDPILAYIKTFNAAAWNETGLGTQVVAPADPWAGRADEAQARGKQLYHGKAQCWTCHPAYVAKQELYDIRQSADFRPGLYDAEPKKSQFAKNGHDVIILPPDFTFSQLRSIRDDHALTDTFSLIAAGIPGTAMPTWTGSLPDEDIWAIAHYVDSLRRLRNTPEAAMLRKQLMEQPEFVPPAPTQPAPTGAGL